VARPSPRVNEKTVRKVERQKPKRAWTLAQGRDIAERSRIWQALLESEDRYRATFDCAPVGIMHTSVDSDRILHANPKLSEMLGYTENELLGMTTDDILHPDHAGADRPRYREKMLSGELDSFSSERKYIRKDSSVIWVNRMVYLARDPLGKPLYFIRIVEDITGRKQAEANLKRLARARHVMAECSRVLVHASDETAMLQEMCRVAVESGGYKMAWVGLATGDPARPVYPAAHAGFEGDAPMTASAAWSADGRYQGFMHEVIATGNPHIARNILRDPALARRRARAVQHGFQSSIALSLEGGGVILGAIAIYAREADAFDEEEIALLTELASDIAYGIVNLRTRIAREQAEERSRETERRFRETFEQAAVGITRVDLNGVLEDVNQKFCDMLGYGKDELLGKHIRDITHPDDYGKGAQYRTELTHRVMKSAVGEKRFVRKDGTVLWARRTMSTACDAAGKPLYVISVVEDITERKELERRFELTFDHAAVGMTQASLDGYLMQVNQKYADMLGYTREELRGMSSDAITHPEDLADTLQTRIDLIEGRVESATGEKRLFRKDRRVIWARRSVSVARGASGEPLYFIAVVEDISSRKEAEAERDRLAAIVEHASDAIIGRALDGTITSWNAAAERMFGYSESEMIGQSISILVPEQHRHLTDNNERLRRGEMIPASERIRVTKDGRTIHVQSGISPIKNEAGEVIGAAVIVRDITERKRLESRFRDTFEQAAVGIIHAGLDGRYLRVNRKLCDITGYTEEELTSASQPRLSHPDDVESGGKDRRRLLSGELSSHSNEKRYLRKDGAQIWVNRTESLARDEAGKPLYLIRVIEDITERMLSAHRRAMEHAVTQALAESATVEGAMQLVLQTICQALEWTCGAYWKWNENDELLRCTETWHVDAAGIADFVAASIERPNEAPAWHGAAPGTNVGGIVRRVWVSGAPVWFHDVTRQPDFRRGTIAAKADLRSAFGFPILSGARPLGVMEFYSRDIRQPDEALLQIVRAIGSQIGQFIQRKEAEQALRTSEERYRDVFEASPLPMWVWDDETLDIVAVNQAAAAHYGYSRDEFLRMNVRDIWAPSEASRYEQDIRNRTQQQALQLQRRHRTKDGRIIDTEVTARLFTLGGRPVWLTVVNDVSVRVSAEAALRESEEQFRQLSGNIPQVFWITDAAQRQTLYVSPAAEAMLGRPLQDILSDRRALIRAIHKEDRARVYAARKAAVEGGYDETYRILRADGSIRWVHDRAFPVHDASGKVYRIAGIAEDVTERKLAEERLLHLAHYDVLTSLPNRVLFYDRLRQALAQARRSQWIVGVMFMDVDRFKNINDTLGHAVGDRLLQQVSERLMGAVRSGDTVGRLGGDEFAIVLSNLASAQDAKLVALKIMASFNEPFRLEGAEIYVTTSIGITLYPDDSTDQDTLIKNADAAMYRAKEAGRNGYQFYTREMSERGIALLNLEGGLRRALERNEFLLYYQLKAGATTGDITGFEALLRWRHPERGLVMPNGFIPVLEETGLIVPVGEWVLNAVCAQLNDWCRAGLNPVPVAINLSARQFLARELGPTIKRILDTHRIDPALIELEITESSLMVNPEEATRTLEYLKSVGVRISIDDFGTGYSSLGYLKRFPLDSLKVDRSFVRDVTTNSDDATITRAVITMAHSLGLTVIAEGVETESQLAFLVENGCDQIQGYYLARPQPAEECARVLVERNRAVPAATGPKLRKA